MYVKLQDIIAQVSGQTWSNYFNSKLRNKIGIEGIWFTCGNNEVYYSKTRSMARFGLLMLHKDKWNTEQILNQAYFNEATSTSQTINQNYDYLW